MPSETRFVGDDELTLAAHVVGPDDGSPVVLLHGAGQTRHSWSGTASALSAAGWRVWSVDHRGHGDSEWANPTDYGIEFFARDVRAIAATMPRPPVFIGASLGGIAALIAIAEADDQREVASAVVLVDIAHRVEEQGVRRIGSFMLGSEDGFDSVESAAIAIAAYNTGRVTPPNLTNLERNLREHPDGRWRWHWDPAYMARTFGPDRPEPDWDRIQRAVTTLAVPTLLVRGRDSDLLSAEGASDFLALAPHAEYADVAGAGHMVVGDRNDVFNAAILDFVERHRP